MFVIPVIASIAACTVVIHSDRAQCSGNEDCVGRGLSANAVCLVGVCAEPDPVAADEVDAAVEDSGPADPIWGCIGKVPPALAPDPSVPVTFRARYVGLISSSAMSGLTIKPCEVKDATCAGFTGTPFLTNDNGQVDVPLHNGFRGYLEIGPSEQVPNLMPTLSYIQPVPDKNNMPEKPFTWVLLTKSDLDFLVANSQKAVNPELGHIIYGTRNCQYVRPPNTRVRAEPIAADTFAFYTDPSGLPSLTQGKTSVSGNGGFINMPPGYVTVHFSTENGDDVGAFEVLVRAGTITQLVFGPAVDIKVE
ncbi:MAG TPA: hypothetical protein VM925_04880 [Labilithrix sp.]|nr:hypothetical protein [Labilithrix sp.]